MYILTTWGSEGRREKELEEEDLSSEGCEVEEYGDGREKVGFAEEETGERLS